MPDTYNLTMPTIILNPVLKQNLWREWELMKRAYDLSQEPERETEPRALARTGVHWRWLSGDDQQHLDTAA